MEPSELSVHRMFTPQSYLRYHFLVLLQLLFDVKSKPTESPKNFTGLHQTIVTTQILSGLGVRHLIAFSPLLRVAHEQ